LLLLLLQVLELCSASQNELVAAGCVAKPRCQCAKRQHFPLLWCRLTQASLLLLLLLLQVLELRCASHHNQPEHRAQYLLADGHTTMFFASLVVQLLRCARYSCLLTRLVTYVCVCVLVTYSPT
jgi:hypothetical protein